MATTRRSPLPLPRIPHQVGVVTTGQARARGWTVDGLRHASAVGRLDRLWRGVYAEPVPSDAAGRDRRLTQLAVAAAVMNPGVHVSHLATASLSGWGWWAPAPQPCVTHDGGLGLTDLSAVHVHRAHLGGFDRWQHGSVPVTSPGRTVCDVAREFGTEAGLCVADAAAHAGDLRRIDLRRSVEQARDWPGGRNLHRLVELLDPRAESVLESRSRYAMPRVGIPPPLTQVLLYDLRGVFIARVDFFWPELGVVGEADGAAKYRGPEDVVQEKDREDAVRRLRLGFVRWRWPDVERFDDVSTRFWQAADDAAQFRAAPRLWTMHQLPLPLYRHRTVRAAAVVGVGGVISAI